MATAVQLRCRGCPALCQQLCVNIVSSPLNIFGLQTRVAYQVKYSCPLMAHRPQAPATVRSQPQIFPVARHRNRSYASSSCQHSDAPTSAAIRPKAACRRRWPPTACLSAVSAPAPQSVTYSLRDCRSCCSTWRTSRQLLMQTMHAHHCLFVTCHARAQENTQHREIDVLVLAAPGMSGVHVCTDNEQGKELVEVG